MLRTTFSWSKSTDAVYMYHTDLLRQWDSGGPQHYAKPWTTSTREPLHVPPGGRTLCPPTWDPTSGYSTQTQQKSYIHMSPPNQCHSIHLQSLNPKKWCFCWLIPLGCQLSLKAPALRAVGITRLLWHYAQTQDGEQPDPDTAGNANAISEQPCNLPKFVLNIQDA